MTTRETVRGFLTNLFAEQGDTQPLADHDSLVLSGRLSSLDVVNTLVFLEQTFGFEMDANDFDPAQFDTVDSIVALVANQPGSR